MRIAFTARFDLEPHFGGVIIYDKQTGQDILIPPGDDCAAFTTGLIAVIDDANKNDATRNDYLAQYFEG